VKKYLIAISTDSRIVFSQYIRIPDDVRGSS